jgi:transcriptional regulator with XRE-family HTH domain
MKLNNPARIWIESHLTKRNMTIQNLLDRVKGDDEAVTDTPKNAISRASLFKFMRGESIKTETLSKIEKFFNNKYPGGKLKKKELTKINNGEMCMSCGLLSGSITDHYDQNKAEVKCGTAKKPFFFQINICCHHSKLFNFYPSKSKPIVNNYQHYEQYTRYKRHRTDDFDHENSEYMKHKFTIILCERCLDQFHPVLKYDYASMLSAIIERKSWSQSLLAKELGIQQSLISRIKTNDVEFLPSAVAKTLHSIYFNAFIEEKKIKLFTYYQCMFYGFFDELSMYGYSNNNYLFDIAENQTENKSKNASEERFKLDIIVTNEFYNTKFGVIFIPHTSTDSKESFEGSGINIFLNQPYIAEQIAKSLKYPLSHLFFVLGATGVIICFKLYPLLMVDIPFANGNHNALHLYGRKKYLSTNFCKEWRGLDDPQEICGYANRDSDEDACTWPEILFGRSYCMSKYEHETVLALEYHEEFDWQINLQKKKSNS